MEWYFMISFIILVVVVAFVLFDEELGKKNKTINLIAASIAIAIFWPLVILIILYLLAEKSKK